MIKKCLTNYFKSLKYFFTPLGTMFLGIMIGVSILVPGVISAATVLIDEIGELSQNINLDLSLLVNNVWQSVQALDWNKPVESLETMLSSEWLNNTLTQSLSAILGTDFETFKAQIASFVSEFLQAVSFNVAVFFVFWVLGFIAGFALIRFLIRRDIARRSLWRFILAYFVNSLLAAGAVILAVFLYTLWVYSIIFTILVGMCLFGMIALVQAYLLYGCKKIPFAKAVNIKNACLYMLANLVIFALSVCFTLVAMLINKFMGVFVGLSFVAIADIVINLNAESYVLAQVNGQGELLNKCCGEITE